jgi:phosphoglycerate dehydrogenase-like enzyme
MPAMTTPMTTPTPAPLTVWCNAKFPPSAMDELRRGLSAHRLVLSSTPPTGNLASSAPDPELERADVALGQPDPAQVMNLPRLRWAHLTSAGYTRYDRDDLRAALRARGAALTNSSTVYAEPCAEHAFAMMMALARRLPQCVDDQRATRPWNAAEHRIHSRVLVGQTVVIVGYGAIGRRLAELLTPLRMNVIAVRRRPAREDNVRVVPQEQLDALLPQADQVVNILPENGQTLGFFGAARLGAIKPGGTFYNIGRGTTVDQDALVAALRSGRLAAAYLDVTDPEPLPPDHPLWSAPHCYITPHTAGGRDDEFEHLVRHFLDNLRRFERGEPLRDRVV